MSACTNPNCEICNNYKQDYLGDFVSVVTTPMETEEEKRKRLLRVPYLKLNTSPIKPKVSFLVGIKTIV